MSTAEHAAIDAPVLRTAVAPVRRSRARALARPCGLAARALIVVGWVVAAAASLPPLGTAGLLGPFCATAALAALLGLAAQPGRIARASAALAACAAALCLVAAPGGNQGLELAGLLVTLGGSALALPAAALTRRG